MKSHELLPAWGAELISARPEQREYTAHPAHRRGGPMLHRLPAASLGAAGRGEPRCEDTSPGTHLGLRAVDEALETARGFLPDPLGLCPRWDPG